MSTLHWIGLVVAVFLVVELVFPILGIFSFIRGARRDDRD